MRSMRMGLIAVGLLAAFLTVVSAQPPGGGQPKGDKGDNKSKTGRPRDGGPGGPMGGVHLVPPFVRDNLNLTDDQQKQIADLEKETTDKLMKILTSDQQKQFKEARPPRRGPGGPDGGPPGGPGGDRGKGGPPGGGPPPGGPPPREPDGQWTKMVG